jgi:hypothetical protein
VPVPQVLLRDQIRIGARKLFERIDAYSAPRLAEYFDPNPCEVNAARALGVVNSQLPAFVAQEDMRRDTPSDRLALAGRALRLARGRPQQRRAREVTSVELSPLRACATS